MNVFKEKIGNFVSDCSFLFYELEDVQDFFREKKKKKKNL
jgi:hypothetical protein